MGVEFCSECGGVVDEIWKRTHDSSLCRKCHDKRKKHEYYLKNKEKYIERAKENNKKYTAEAKKEKKRKERRALQARERRARNKRVSDEKTSNEKKNDLIQKYLEENGYV